MLDVSDLHGKTFLDVGSGSGSFSLAASDLGAKVVSFDFDTASVNCTKNFVNYFIQMILIGLSCKDLYSIRSL